MTQYSFPWNDVNGDRLYDADDFMRFFAAFLKTGVVMSYKGGLRVRSAQNGMNIQVGSGSAVIEGSSYLNDADIGIQVNVASSIQDRVDSVVLRMDKNARTTQLFYKPGDTTVARNDTTYELQLASISVKTNATQITDADITDMRSDFTVCGWSTPFDNINVDGIVDQYKEIFEQKDLEFQAWFQNIFASGSLSSKIVSTKIESPAIKHTFVRVGNMVTLTTETKSGIAQTTYYDIPSGYRPFNDGTDPIYEQVLSGGKSAIIRSSVATWQPRVSAGLDAGLFGTISWPTKDSFPG